MIKECNHNWHFMNEFTDWEYFDSGNTFSDGEKIDGVKCLDTYAKFICSECHEIKKVKIDD